MGRLIPILALVVAVAVGGWYFFLRETEHPLLRMGLENLIAETIPEAGLAIDAAGEMTLNNADLDGLSVAMTGTYASEEVASAELTALAIESEGYKFWCASDRYRAVLESGYTLSGDFSYADGTEIGTVLWTGTNLCPDS